MSQLIEIKAFPEFKGMKPFRETFGVIDGKTGKIYPDILLYKLGFLEVNQSILGRESLIEDGAVYQIHMDSKTKRAIRGTGIGDFVKVIVSYQVRLTGNFAMVRIWKGKD